MYSAESIHSIEKTAALLLNSGNLHETNECVGLSGFEVSKLNAWDEQPVEQDEYPEFVSECVGLLLSLCWSHYR
jgi:hypothetical protein